MYEFFLALLETVMLEVGLLVREGQFFLFIYVVIIVSVIILLQIETIRKSHSLHGESSTLLREELTKQSQN